MKRFRRELQRCYSDTCDAARRVATALERKICDRKVTSEQSSSIHLMDYLLLSSIQLIQESIHLQLVGAPSLSASPQLCSVHLCTVTLLRVLRLSFQAFYHLPRCSSNKVRTGYKAYPRHTQRILGILLETKPMKQKQVSKDLIGIMIDCLHAPTGGVVFFF